MPTEVIDTGRIEQLPGHSVRLGDVKAEFPLKTDRLRHKSCNMPELNVIPPQVLHVVGLTPRHQVAAAEGRIRADNDDHSGTTCANLRDDADYLGNAAIGSIDAWGAKLAREQMPAAEGVLNCLWFAGDWLIWVRRRSVWTPPRLRSRREIADRREKPAVVEPVDPFERCGLDRAPGAPNQITSVLQSPWRASV